MRRSLQFAIAVLLGALLCAGFVTTSAAISARSGATRTDSRQAPLAAAPAPSFSETDHVSFQTPCRIVDTRAAGGAIALNTVRKFRVRGTSGFPSQGGKSGGCSIPASAGAILATISLSSETGNGF